MSRVGTARDRAVRPRLGRVALTGAVATVAAAALTTLAGVAATAVGVGFEIPDGGEAIPVGGFTTVTAGFSLVGVGLALVLARWSDRPARRFLRIAGALLVASLVPPFIVGADAATVASLVALHLLAAAVMIPALGQALRAQPRSR